MLNATLIAAGAKESAPVRDLSGYILWTAVLVVVVLGVYLLMWRSWRRRGRRQAETLPPLPAVPEQRDGDPTRVSAGMYHGSTTAGAWLDRTIARGLGTRGRADLVLTAAGVEVRRAGADDFLIPAAALRGARTDRGIAGKVVPAGGMLVLTWEHGGRLLDTGFRSDHPAEHPAWAEEAAALVPAEHRDTGADQTDPSTKGAPTR